MLGFPVRLSIGDERSAGGDRSTNEDEYVQPAWCAFAIVAGVSLLNISARDGWSSVLILNFIDSDGPFLFLIPFALFVFFTNDAIDGEDVANTDS
jgi:hypothetical protein